MSNTNTTTNNSPHFLSYPFWLEVSQGITIALVVGFTSATSILRLAALAHVLYVPWYMATRCRDQVFYAAWASTIGSHSSAYLFQYIELALLSRWTFQAAGPTALDPNIRLARTSSSLRKEEKGRPGSGGRARRDTVWNRLRFGVSACFDSRMIDSPFEVKGVPPFSSTDPSHVPTRGKFILQRLKALLLCYLVIDLFASAGKANAHKNGSVYSLHLTPFLRRLGHITVEELVVRVTATLAWWVNIYCLLEGLRSIVAILAVVMGLTPVAAWRPWFGSMREAYTLRRFWSISWHQANRQRFTAPASWLTYSVLRFRKGGLLGRYLFCCLVFFMSGLQHVVTDMAGGMSFETSGSIQFFVTQFFGILLEDAVQNVWRRVGGVLNRRATVALGFVWVGLFQVWSTPVWLYPMLVDRKGLENEKLLPFSVVQSVNR